MISLQVIYMPHIGLLFLSIYQIYLQVSCYEEVHSEEKEIEQNYHQFGCLKGQIVTDRRWPNQSLKKSITSNKNFRCHKRQVNTVFMHKLSLKAEWKSQSELPLLPRHHVCVVPWEGLYCYDPIHRFSSFSDHFSFFRSPWILNCHLLLVITRWLNSVNFLDSIARWHWD